MKFSIKDLPNNTGSLISFLRNRPYLKIEDKLIGNNLFAIYSKSKSIEALEDHIENNKNNMRFRKHFKTWGANLSILKGLK